MAAVIGGTKEGADDTCSGILTNAVVRCGRGSERKIYLYGISLNRCAKCKARLRSEDDTCDSCKYIHKIPRKCTRCSQMSNAVMWCAECDAYFCAICHKKPHVLMLGSVKPHHCFPVDGASGKHFVEAAWSEEFVAMVQARHRLRLREKTQVDDGTAKVPTQLSGQPAVSTFDEDVETTATTTTFSKQRQPPVEGSSGAIAVCDTAKVPSAFTAAGAPLSVLRLKTQEQSRKRQLSDSDDTHDRAQKLICTNNSSHLGGRGAATSSLAQTPALADGMTLYDRVKEMHDKRARSAQSNAAQARSSKMSLNRLVSKKKERLRAQVLREKLGLDRVVQQHGQYQQHDQIEAGHVRKKEQRPECLKSVEVLNEQVSTQWHETAQTKQEKQKEEARGQKDAQEKQEKQEEEPRQQKAVLIEQKKLEEEPRQQKKAAQAEQTRQQEEARQQKAVQAEQTRQQKEARQQKAVQTEQTRQQEETRQQKAVQTEQTRQQEEARQQKAVQEEQAMQRWQTKLTQRRHANQQRQEKRKQGELQQQEQQRQQHLLEERMLYEPFLFRQDGAYSRMREGDQFSSQSQYVVRTHPSHTSMASSSMSAPMPISTMPLSSVSVLVPSNASFTQVPSPAHAGLHASYFESTAQSPHSYPLPLNPSDVAAIAFSPMENDRVCQNITTAPASTFETISQDHEDKHHHAATDFQQEQQQHTNFTDTMVSRRLATRSGEAVSPSKFGEEDELRAIWMNDYDNVNALVIQLDMEITKRTEEGHSFVHMSNEITIPKQLKLQLSNLCAQRDTATKKRFKSLARVLIFSRAVRSFAQQNEQSKIWNDIPEVLKASHKKCAELAASIRECERQAQKVREGINAAVFSGDPVQMQIVARLGALIADLEQKICASNGERDKQLIYMFQFSGELRNMVRAEWAATGRAYQMQ